MIFVGGVFFSNPNSSSQGNNNLDLLLEHPILVSAGNLFKAIPERKLSTFENLSSERSSQVKLVYVFQREYATVDPTLVELVGTDEATTCVGLVIRNQRSGMTSVAHLDSRKVVVSGLDHMLPSVISNDEDAELDGAGDTVATEIQEKMGGHSLSLCTEIIEALHSRMENFHIQTLCVLQHNTRRDSSGNLHPIVNGFVVETSNGSITPASFDKSSRCPDEIVRRVRVTVSSEDPNWNGKLLETYETHRDKFSIAACSWGDIRFTQPNCCDCSIDFPVPETYWNIRMKGGKQWNSDWKYFAFEMLQCSDSEILLSCSTSPSAENPDFVENERRVFNYLIKYSDWRKTFPMRKPRVFERTANGGWLRCE